MKILTVIFSFGLLLLSLLGCAAWLYAMMDPVGFKMADDPDPFGVPPSFNESLSWFVAFLLMGVVGVYLLVRQKDT